MESQETQVRGGKLSEAIDAQVMSAKDVIRVSLPIRELSLPMISENRPANFGMVLPGLYRSGYPQALDFPFIQRLRLKTIVTLVNKEFPDGYQDFIYTNRITHKVFDMAGTKKEAISEETMRAIFAVVSNPKNYPLLIHCNQGKHRTGCVVGVIRKHGRWSTERIIEEYIQFAEPKVRETDVAYLTAFQLASLQLEPQGTSSVGSNIGRFCKFVAMTLIVMLILWPLDKLRMPKPPSRPRPLL
ncbi:hypothetical protein F5Y16DRAFT_342934 [Xylariaceae sp. FL0255]|nr:hypothetical protein F5Y16DRAFT_342934 [Xylariaceae sp. FL0255]